jgi:hypothetical protein
MARWNSFTAMTAVAGPDGLTSALTAKRTGTVRPVYTGSRRAGVAPTAAPTHRIASWGE